LIRKLTVGRRASADIINIWEYTAGEHGSEAADNYIRELDAAMQMAAKYPKIGTDCANIRKGYRRMLAGSHLLYYIAHKTGIEVIRVLHVRMDATRHLSQ